MTNATSVIEPTVLLDGLAYVESPRWHDGRLWFAHWGAGGAVAVDLTGNSEVVGHGPPRLGGSIDWLPDGRLLVTGDELLRQEPDGTTVQHADLSDLVPFWNEIVVDGRGNVYLNSIAFQFLAGAKPTSGIIALLRPDGSARQVAGDLAFPNGMVITPDNSTLIISESMAGQLTAFDIAADGSLANRRVWAQGLLPDGICMDDEGAVWVQTKNERNHSGGARGPEGAVVRVHEGGEPLERIEHDRPILRQHARWPRRQDPIPRGRRVARHRTRRTRGLHRADPYRQRTGPRDRMAVSREPRVPNI